MASTRRISISDAEAGLSALVDGVKRGERYVIERQGTALAAVIAVEDLQRLPDEPQKEPGGGLALEGALEMTDDEFERFLSDIYEERLRDLGRDVPSLG